MSEQPAKRDLYSLLAQPVDDPARSELIDQPALDFMATAPVTHAAPTSAEVIARGEIDLFYECRYQQAMDAYLIAKTAMDEALHARDAWREHGRIVCVHPPTSPERMDWTVQDIANDSMSRHTQAMRDVLRPALDAPTTAAAIGELRRLDSRADTSARRAAAERAKTRCRVLFGWLTGQGYDLGPLAEALDG